MEPRKQAIITALWAFVRQRPGLEFANYGDVASYRSESRRIAMDKRHAETLLSAAAKNDGITADMIVKASESAFSGRLTIHTHSECITDGGGHGSDPDGTEWYERARINYCAGQYFPTEYRKAVAAVCASALWYYVREHEMPKPFKVYGSDTDWYSWKETPLTLMRPVSAGEWLRAYFRREFGRTIAGRYFQ